MASSPPGRAAEQLRLLGVAFKARDGAAGTAPRGRTHPKKAH